MTSLHPSSSKHDASSSNPPPPPTSSRLYIDGKVTEILAKRDVTRIAKLVRSLCHGKEKDESSKLLYDSFARHFPNLLAVRLLQAYRFTPYRFSRIRSHSLSLLDSLLIDLEDSRTGLTEKALRDIKKDLNWCLLQQETSEQDFKLLARIASRVTVDSFINSILWEELCFFILSLHEDSKKTLLVFSELPIVLEEDFLTPFLENNLEVKIARALLDRDRDDEEEWCLALEAAFSLMLQVISLQRRDLVWNSVYAILRSVWEMVHVRKRGVAVRRGLLRLARKVSREALRFHKPEYEAVSHLVFWIKRFITGDSGGDDSRFKATVIAAETIQDVLEKNYMNW